jgi:hypothetical protein
VRKLLTRQTEDRLNWLFDYYQNFENQQPLAWIYGVAERMIDGEEEKLTLENALLMFELNSRNLKSDVFHALNIKEKASVFARRSRGSPNEKSAFAELTFRKILYKDTHNNENKS